MATKIKKPKKVKSLTTTESESFKINNEAEENQQDILWLVDYDKETGEVLSTSPDEGDAMVFDTEQDRNDAITLINSNPINIFIGHVPRPR